MPHTWSTEVWLPQSAEALFAFLSDVTHLDALTPPWLGIRVLTPAPIAMGRGALIDYELRLGGLPLRWRTEITAWEPPHRFAERQARGPFRSWEQEHRFDSRDGGTLVRDVMAYEVLGGALASRMLVVPLVSGIFAHRAGRLAERFGRVAPETGDTSDIIRK